jgi:hypothetical protein
MKIHSLVWRVAITMMGAGCVAVSADEAFGIVRQASVSDDTIGDELAHADVDEQLDPGGDDGTDMYSLYGPPRWMPKDGWPRRRRGKDAGSGDAGGGVAECGRCTPTLVVDDDATDYGGESTMDPPGGPVERPVPPSDSDTVDLDEPFNDRTIPVAECKCKPGCVAIGGKERQRGQWIAPGKAFFPSWNITLPTDQNQTRQCVPTRKRSSSE